MGGEASIEVRTYGRGPGPVVLVHGGPGAPGCLAALARQLGRAFHVLEPLQRGSGGAPLSVARHVEDMAAVLPDRAVLVGHSWGAMLSLSFAAAHPDRVRGIALIGCGTYDLRSRAAYQRGMAERLGAELRARNEELAEDLAAGDDEAAAQVFAETAWIAAEAQRFDAHVPRDDVVRYDPRGHRETWQDVLRLQAEGVEPAAFGTIEAPILMLHGAEDPHPGPATRDVLRVHLPQLTYVELPRCGHEPWLERQAAEPFLRALGSWLRQILEGAGPS